MEKCSKNGGFSYKHHEYKIFKNEDGKIYVNEDGILTEGCVHLDWDEIITYLKEIGKV